MAPIFDDLTIALSGTFPGHTHGTLTKSIKENGGKVSAKITISTTHLVASEKDYESQTVKVKQALGLSDIKIISLDWLLKSIDEDDKLDEDQFLVGKTTPAKAKDTKSAPTKPDDAKADGIKTDGTKKRTRNGKAKPKSEPDVEDESEEEEVKQPPPDNKKQARNGNAKTKPESKAKAKAKAKEESPEIQEEEVEQPPPAKKQKEANKAKSSNLSIPVDEGCALQGTHRVYISDEGTIFDVALNQTNAGNNNNKFYRIQLLENGSSNFRTWTRWGRVGEHGQNALLGYGDFNDAMRHFEKKFKDKTGHKWDDRLNPPKKGKYTFVERNYETDSSDDDDDPPGAKDRKVSKLSKANQVEKKKVESKLSLQVKQLMELIFNQQLFAANLSEMNYDANKLPLGKLSKHTLKRGFQALKELAEVIANPALSDELHNMTFNDAVNEISNSYYSLIPHNFGRTRPTVIRDEALLKKEIELLESLTDMDIANDIMKETKEESEDIMHPLDRQFTKLGMDEMTSLEPKSTEFNELADYLIKSHGSTHYFKFKVESIFRIERSGEGDRFGKSKYAKLNGDRRLLWHGSRTTNFGGILSQGLRIAPPEAPVSGYMFGKGVYLADISSKSANYCVPHSSGGVGLLLLCEAELGKPMLELTGSDYNAGEEAKKQGRHATWGKGMTAPLGWKDAACVNANLKGVQMPDMVQPPGNSGVANAYLQYNEYICYSVEQIRLRYLFRVKMT